MVPMEPAAIVPRVRRVSVPPPAPFLPLSSHATLLSLSCPCLASPAPPTLLSCPSHAPVLPQSSPSPKKLLKNVARCVGALSVSVEKKETMTKTKNNNNATHALLTAVRVGRVRGGAC